MQEGIDNDDGSNNFNSTFNVLYLSGNEMKNDFGGHSNHHINNVAAYVGHGFGVCAQLPGQEDHYQNNTLVMTSSGNYGSGTCPPSEAYVVTSGNKVYTQDGNV